VKKKKRTILRKKEVKNEHRMPPLTKKRVSKGKTGREKEPKNRVQGCKALLQERDEEKRTRRRKCEKSIARQELKKEKKLKTGKNRRLRGMNTVTQGKPKKTEEKFIIAGGKSKGTQRMGALPAYTAREPGRGRQVTGSTVLNVRRRKGRGIRTQRFFTQGIAKIPEKSGMPRLQNTTEIQETTGDDTERAGFGSDEKI